MLDQRRHVIVRQTGAIPHVDGLDPERLAPRASGGLEQPGPQQLVERLPEREAAHPAFAPNPLQNVLVQGDRRSDAHDALMIASRASTAPRVRTDEIRRSTPNSDILISYADHP